ncbi:hypothetical protein VXN63_00240 [Marinilactibacillus sp. XAAS-LB27]|uniref:hypothetical protein n=1 Tax=Marinilactibacillus sp. XAAS-LB27 TaxID=3114538 RepID=UPI002E171104|nr:hypothetical protein [Marinilactibacillus sp. XAAS-LB27]
MDNQPGNTGQPGALNSDPVNQSERFADGRSISDLTKNKGKDDDHAAYADDQSNQVKESDKEVIPEDFEPFDLDKIEE